MREDHPKDELTGLIDLARQGDPAATNSLCRTVYDELHRMARRLMPHDDESLQPTMLVNDLWVKLFSRGGLKKTENRRYFFTVAANQMRFILIDHYRKRKQKKRGGDRIREPFEIAMDQAISDFERQSDHDFEDINQAVENLRAENQRLYDVVMQRYFAGLTVKKTAEVLGMSESSVERDWRLARAKLRLMLKD